MNKILCFALVICASMALISAYPAPDDVPYLGLEETAPVVKVDDETLQPEESRYARHSWGYGGWGRRGWGNGGWGRGWGYGGGWGRGGWGYRGGYGGGYGYGGWGGW